MSGLNIFLLDNFNKAKDEALIVKPETFGELLNKIDLKIKGTFDNYELFILDRKNKEIKINNEEEYKLIKDILFIRKIDEKNNMNLSLYEKNFNKLSLSKQDILNEKYNCNCCFDIIKNENPYLCYKCQKIFHEKCLKKWDKQCKSQNSELKCPNCRNELSLKNWKKKLYFEENRKDNAFLIEELNKYKLSNNMNNNINIIKQRRINELEILLSTKQKTIIHYELYKEKVTELIKKIINKLNLIYSILKSKNNNHLNNLNISNIENLDIDKISNLIDEEFDKIIYNLAINNKIKNKITQKYNNYENIKKINKTIKITDINRSIKIFDSVNETINYKKINIKEPMDSVRNKLKNKVINKFNEQQKSEIKNKINLIYFAKSKGNYNIFGEKFVENNKDNIDLIINNIQNKLVNKCELIKGDNNITLIIKNKLINLSYMFYECETLKDINELKYLNVKDVKDFSYMFYGCTSLSNINSLQYFNLSNCENLNSIFSKCCLLSDLKSIENWDVSKCKNFSNMFHGCSLLSDIIPLQKWNVSNGNNFEGMFYECSSLLNLEPLQYWNISKEKLKNIK